MCYCRLQGELCDTGAEFNVYSTQCCGDFLRVKDPNSNEYCMVIHTDQGGVAVTSAVEMHYTSHCNDVFVFKHDGTPHVTDCAMGGNVMEGPTGTACNTFG